MSAFVVEDKTINEIVGAIFGSHLRYEQEAIMAAASVEDQDPAKLGAALLKLNVESCKRRYPSHASEFTAANYQFHWEEPNIFQALQSMRCWLYQSCEGGCEKERLYQAIDHASLRLAYSIVNSLPEYQKTEWR